MDGHPVQVVEPKRANRARRILGPWCAIARARWVEHRMIDDELTAAVEELRECPASFRALKHVLVLDRFPRKLAPRLAELIALSRELLLLDQMPFASLDPLVVGHDLVTR